MIEFALIGVAGFILGAFVRPGARSTSTAQTAPGHVFNGPMVPPKVTQEQFARMPVELRKRYIEQALGRPSIKPKIGRYTPGEAEALLQGGLVGLNVYQLRKGVPGISWALHAGLVRYERSDPHEEWKSIREIWEDPHFLDGKPFEDCEGLSAAVAAERIVAGRPSTVELHRVNPRLAHAVVRDLQTGELLDPNITGGMRGKAQ